MARRSKIPVEFHQRAIRDGHVRESMLVVKMKTECGQRVPRGKYDTRLLLKCLKLGFVSRDKQGFYWQLPWSVICKDYESITYAYIDHKLLKKKDYKLVAYCVCTGYLQRLSDEDGGKPLGKRPSHSRRKRTLKPGSIHKDGLANSIVGDFFDKSPQWASKMRGLAVKAGMITVKRRYVPCPNFGKVDAHQELPVAHCRLPDGSVAREIASEITLRNTFWFVVPSNVRKNRPKRVFSAKEGIYV